MIVEVDHDVTLDEEDGDNGEIGEPAVLPFSQSD